MDALFGSATRARLLEQLAVSPRPQTDYFVAQAIGAEPIQVLRILNSLDGIAERPRHGWVLTDELLRKFLIERYHRAAEARRAEKDELLLRHGMRPSLQHRRKSLR